MQGKRKDRTKDAAKANTRLSPVAIRKTPTGIAGFDDVLRGGIPTERLTLICGGPGTCKTMMGTEFLYRGAIDGIPGILVSFEERAEVIRENAATIGWDIAGAEKAKTLAIVEARMDPEAVFAGEFNLRGLIAIVDGVRRKIGATRIFIDAPDVMLRLFDDVRRERAELYALNDWLRDNGLTAIMSVKISVGEEHSERYDFLDFMADCVIYLDHRVKEQISTRRLRVQKFRGSDAGRNEYPFSVAENGLQIHPVTSIGLRHGPLGPAVSSGIPSFDEMLGGGFRRSACILISGTSGTGKTTFVSTFTESACARGERVLYLDFEESPDAIVHSLRSAGIDLRPCLKSGRLKFLPTQPEALGVEEHLTRTIEAINEHNPDHIVIDAISACLRMGIRNSAFDFLLRLIDTCKERGITSILTNLTSSAGGAEEITGIDLSSLIDGVILLRNVETAGEMNRVLVVLKFRGQAHSNLFREFRITSTGIQILDAYRGVEGMLTGAARTRDQALRELEGHERQIELRRLEASIRRKEAVLAAQIDQMSAEIEGERARLEAVRAEPGGPPQSPSSKERRKSTDAERKRTLSRGE